MSDRIPKEGLVLIKLPQKFVRHWQDEAMRLRDLTIEIWGRGLFPKLSEFLYHSLAARNTGLRGDPRGDDTLAKHIDGSLEALWVEIEQVRDGFWEPRAWEEEEDE